MEFEKIKKILSSKIVGIAGAGGLGSNCAASLIRVGVGKLIIADFDIVTESNLNRQFYFFNQIGMKKVEALKENLLKINPKVEILCLNEKLGPQSIINYYKNCDIIVEAFDKAEMKKMLIETVLENFPEKYIIAASGLAGFGNVNEMTIKKYDNLYICGDNKNEVSEIEPPLSPKVNIAANMQADLVLSILLQ